MDAETQVIVAAEVTQQVLDRGQLLLMLESTGRNTGERPEVVSADAGYWETDSIQEAIRSGAQILVPPDGAATLRTRQPRRMANNPLAQHILGRLVHRLQVAPDLSHIFDYRAQRVQALLA